MIIYRSIQDRAIDQALARRSAVKATAASLRIARGFAQSATHAGRVRFCPAPHAS